MKFGAPERPRDVWSAYSRFDFTMNSTEFWDMVGDWFKEAVPAPVSRRHRPYRYYNQLNRDFLRLELWSKAAATEFMLRWGDHPALVDGRTNTNGSCSKIVVDRFNFWIDAPWAEVRPVVVWCIENLQDYHWDWGGSLHGRWYFWIKTEAAMAAFAIRWSAIMKSPPIPDPFAERLRLNQLLGYGANVRAITLWQPFASLIFAGKKLHETRSFRPPLMQDDERLAIHAAAKMAAPREISPELHALCVETFGPDYRETLPCGAVLGTVSVDECVATDTAQDIDPANRAAGDWTPGRYAWRLGAIAPLPSPLPMKGKQGWWRIPRETLEKAFSE